MVKKSSKKGFLGMKPTVNPMIRPAAGQENNGKDKIGAYPANVRVPVLEGRRHLWTTRVFAIGFYLSMLFNIILVLTIYAMMPLKKVEPFLVSFSAKENQVVRIMPATMVQDGFGVFVEKLAMEFVKIRQEYLADPQEQQNRWLVYLASRMNKLDHVEFIKGVEPVYNELQQKGFTRQVEILDVNRGNTNNFIAIKFKTIDYDRFGNNQQEMTWVAQMRYAFYNQETTNQDKYLNPFGFRVISYGVQRGN